MKAKTRVEYSLDGAIEQPETRRKPLRGRPQKRRRRASERPRSQTRSRMKRRKTLRNTRMPRTTRMMKRRTSPRLRTTTKTRRTTTKNRRKTTSLTIRRGGLGGGSSPSTSMGMTRRTCQRRGASSLRSWVATRRPRYCPARKTARHCCNRDRRRLYLR